MFDLKFYFIFSVINSIIQSWQIEKGKLKKIIYIHFILYVHRAPSARLNCYLFAINFSSIEWGNQHENIFNEIKKEEESAQRSSLTNIFYAYR